MPSRDVELERLREKRSEAVHELARVIEERDAARAELERVKADRHQVELNYHHMVDVAQGLREALREARDHIQSEATHVGMDGPNAGWHGEGEDAWYDHDLVCTPNCPACAAVRDISAALDEEEADHG